MNPKEKAKSLLNRFKTNEICFGYDGSTEKSIHEASLKCALICVEEIMKMKPTNPVDLFKEYETIEDRVNHSLDYWKSVKEELKNL